VIMDAPIVVDQGAGLGLWKPENYEQDFLGPTTLRVGLERSRNLMTVRVAQAIGMDKVAAVAKRLGVVDDMQPVLAMALGAADTTVLRLTNAYSQIDNGGKKVMPTLIDRVQDKLGHTIFRHDERPCEGCLADWHGQPPPVVPDTREQVIDPATAYQMVSMMQGVVQRGTGAIVGTLGRPLAGKTGTTNNSNDVWFVGYSPDLAVGCYMGYDQPRSLGGDAATGGMIIAPLFKSFIAEALQGQPNVPFRIPPGIRLVRVDRATGLRAQPGDTNVILEAFKPGTEPNGDSEQVLMGVGAATSGAGDAPTPASDSSGGLY
jgi:penicillin-binding protein 1A